LSKLPFRGWSQSLLVRAAGVLLLAVLPVYGLLAGYNYQRSVGLLQEQVRSQQGTWVSTQRIAILTALSQELDRLLALANDSTLIQETWAAQNPPDPAGQAARWEATTNANSPDRTSYLVTPPSVLLRTYRARFDYRSVVVLADYEAHMIGVTNAAWPHWDLSRNDWWRAARQGVRTGIWIGTPQTLAGIPGRVLLVGVPVMRPATLAAATPDPAGILLVGINFDDLVGPLLNYVLPVDGASTAWLVSDDGTVLARSAQQPGAGQQLPASWKEAYRRPDVQVEEVPIDPTGQPNPSLLTGVSLTLAGGSSQLDPTVLDGLNRMGWSLVLTVPQATAYRTLSEQLALLGLATVALAAELVVVVVLVLGILVIRPLYRLAGAMDRVAAGDFAARVPIANKTEIGRLAVRFNNMIRAVVDLVAERAARQQRQDQVSSQLQVAARTLNATAHQQTAIAQQQARAMADLSTNLTELGQAAAFIAGYADQVANAANTLLHQQQSGMIAVGGARDALSALHTEAGAMARAVDTLARDSADISQIMHGMSGIADETHLLALNAAIEAAGAGEHGRRFAVVAREVQDLAEQARSATEAVRTMLERIRSGIDEAVSRTERELAAVSLGVQTGESISVLMDTLLTAAEQLTGTAEQIRAGTHQQRTGSQQAAGTLQDLVAASHQLAQYSGAVSNAADQLEALALQLGTAPDSAPLADPPTEGRAARDGGQSQDGGHGTRGAELAINPQPSALKSRG